MTEALEEVVENIPKVYHRHGKDDWETPDDIFNRLDYKWGFDIDVAAEAHNAKVPNYIGPDHEIPACRDALTCSWGPSGFVAWCNPPYSLCKKFVARAWGQSTEGVTTVMLLPARTDVKWFHQFVWDRQANHPRTGVSVEFLKGRIKFVGADAGAPFPSMIVVFHGRVDG